MAEPSKGPRKPSSKPAADDTPLLTLTVDGDFYKLTHEPSWQHEMELYRACKLTFADLIGFVQSDNAVPPFAVAAVVFLAKRERGERASFDLEVAALSYSTPVVWFAPEPEPPAPEAPGSD